MKIHPGWPVEPEVHRGHQVQRKPSTGHWTVPFPPNKRNAPGNRERKRLASTLRAKPNPRRAHGRSNCPESIWSLGSFYLMAVPAHQTPTTVHSSENQTPFFCNTRSLSGQLTLRGFMDVTGHPSCPKSARRSPRLIRKRIPEQLTVTASDE